MPWKASGSSNVQTFLLQGLDSYRNNFCSSQQCADRSACPKRLPDPAQNLSDMVGPFLQYPVTVPVMPKSSSYCTVCPQSPPEFSNSQAQERRENSLLFSTLTWLFATDLPRNLKEVVLFSWASETLLAKTGTNASCLSLLIILRWNTLFKCW